MDSEDWSWLKYACYVLLTLGILNSGILAETCGFIKVSTQAIRLSNEDYQRELIQNYLQQKGLHTVKN